MPKYIEKPIGFWGKIIIAVLLSLVALLVWLYPFLLGVIPIIIALEIKDRIFRKKHFMVLLKGRDTDSICTFSRYFECRKIDTWVIRAVYEQLQNYLAPEKVAFPIRPQDDVFKDLLIDNEDFEFDIVEEIAERAGRSLENTESNRYNGKASIVENLVYFFNEQPKVNPT
jgi:hypothetical protein